jgi:hypothetical protein
MRPIAEALVYHAIGLSLASAALLAAGAPSMAANAPLLNKKGQMMVGGKPFFPVGIYAVPLEDIPSLPAESFNVIINPYWTGSVASARRFVDAARAKDMMFISGFSPHAKVAAKDGAFLEQMVQGLKDDANLLVWNLYEEPPNSKVTAEAARFAYETTSKLDPTRPKMFVDFQLREDFRKTYDIFGYDAYPVGGIRITQWRDRLQKIVQSLKPVPVWAVVQAFGVTSAEDVAKTTGRSQWVLPTPEEERLMCYEAILQGAQGILFYQYLGQVRRRTEFGNYILQLGAELRSLTHAFLAPSVKERLSIGNKEIDADLREVAAPENPAAKQLYLIAANGASATSAVARHFPGVLQTDVRIAIKGAPRGQAELIGSAGTSSAKAGRIVTLRDGAFTDSFEPHGVHVYKITVGRSQ